MTTNYESVIETLNELGRKSDDWREKKGAEIDEMKTTLDELLRKSDRPNLGGSGAPDLNNPEVKALNNAARALIMGNQEKANEYFVEAKAMSAGSDPDGGYVVHDAISSGMTKVMAEISPIYRLARKIPMSKGGAFEEPVDRDAAEAAWVGEVQARPDTDTPELKAFRVELNEIYAMPKASQKLIDIASINVIGWLQEKVGDAFAVKEGDAYHNGDGVARPRGILTYTTSATSDASRAWGTIEHVVTGASGAFHTTKADCLQDVVAALKTQYRNGAVWLMNRRTANAIRKMKEGSTDAYIWQPGLQLGQPDALLGYRVEIDENMPDMAAGSLSIAFGNVNKAYTIIEQPGTKFLTDPYTDKPNVRLFAYRRVGGGLNNSEALKLVKFST